MALGLREFARPALLKRAKEISTDPAGMFYVCINVVSFLSYDFSSSVGEPFIFRIRH